MVNNNECACQRKLLELVSNKNVLMNLDIRLLSTSKCTFFTNAAHWISSAVLVGLASSGVVDEGVFDDELCNEII